MTDCALCTGRNNSGHVIFLLLLFALNIHYFTNRVSSLKSPEVCDSLPN